MTKNNLEILVIFLISLTFCMVLVYPKYEDFQASQSKLESKKLDLKNREDYYVDLNKISEQLKQNQESLSKVEAGLPVDPKAAGFANFLQAITSQSGLILKNFSYSYANPSSVATKKSSPQASLFTIKNYDVTLHLSGSYQGFKEFLSRIEKSSRLIDVSEVSFSASSNNNETTVPTFEFVDEEGGQESEGLENIYDFNIRLKVNYY